MNFAAGSRDQRYRRAAIFLLACGAVALGSLALRINTDEAIRIDYLGAGEALWYGVPLSAVSWHLPAAGLTAAALYDHAPYLNGGVPVLASILLAALGDEIFSPVLAVAALPIWIFSDSFICFPQSVFISLVLIVSGLLVFRARHPSPMSAWAVALAVGCTLIYRSTLVFFPPVLALFEILSSWRRKKRVLKKEILILALAPYLFLLPWISMNAALYKKFIPLENGEADSNVVAGALGIVGTVEGNWRALPSKPMTRPILVWAAATVARSPLCYMGACFRRLMRVIGWNPFLFILAGIGFLSFPFKSRIAPLFLLAVYLLLIHCLMAVESNYFAPLRPLLAVFAALPLVFLAPPAEDGAGTAILAAALVSAIFLSAFVSERVIRYPRAVASKNALDRALSRSPDNGWLLHEKGLRDILRGDVKSAGVEFSQAARGLPFSSYELDAAWAGFLNGQTKALADFSFPQNGARASREMKRFYLMKSLAFFALRQPRKGRVLLGRALAMAGAESFVRGPSSSGEMVAAKMLRLEAIRDFKTNFARLPGWALISPSLRAVLNKEIDRASKRILVRSENLRPVITSGLSAPAPVSEISRPQEYLHGMALFLQEGEISRPIARLLFKFLAARYPADEIYRRDLAVCEYLMGDSVRAEADLKLARSLNPHDPAVYLSLEAMESARKNFAGAHEDCREALRSVPWDYELAPIIDRVCGDSLNAGRVRRLKKGKNKI